jgi:hypothetical protein
MGEPTPNFDVPMSGKYLWDIFFALHHSISRAAEGVYHLIPPSEYDAWFRLTNTLVYAAEYDILVAMDRAYCTEANKELEDVRTKQQEEQQRQIEESRNKRGRR